MTWIFFYLSNIWTAADWMFGLPRSLLIGVGLNKQTKCTQTGKLFSEYCGVKSEAHCRRLTLSSGIFVAANPPPTCWFPLELVYHAFEGESKYWEVNWFLLQPRYPDGLFAGLLHPPYTALTTPDVLWCISLTRVHAYCNYTVLHALVSYHMPVAMTFSNLGVHPLKSPVLVCSQFYYPLLCKGVNPFSAHALIYCTWSVSNKASESPCHSALTYREPSRFITSLAQSPDSVPILDIPF